MGRKKFPILVLAGILVILGVIYLTVFYNSGSGQTFDATIKMLYLLIITMIVQRAEKKCYHFHHDVHSDAGYYKPNLCICL